MERADGGLISLTFCKVDLETNTKMSKSNAQNKPASGSAKKIPYLSIKGAGEVAGCTEGAIRMAINRGRLRCTETADGVLRLVSEKDLAAWLETSQ